MDIFNTYTCMTLILRVTLVFLLFIIFYVLPSIFLPDALNGVYFVYLHKNVLFVRTAFVN